MRHLAILLFLVAGLLSWSGAHAQLDGIDIICDDWPPYTIVDGGNITGFSTRIVEVVFKRMGVRINSIKPYPWRRAIMMIEDGATDALMSANFTQERAVHAYYPAETLVESPWVLWARRGGDLNFDTYEDLSQKRIGVVLGYSYTPDFWKFLRKHNNYEEVVIDDQNFKKLDAGRIDCTVAELGNGNYIKNRLGFGDILPLREKPIKIDGLYIIFSKKRVPESFVRQFSEELTKIKTEAIYKYLYDRYLGFD